MSQSPHVIAPPTPPEHNSEWASVCAELQTKLPGELLEIESKRIRVEAVVAKLDIGNVLRHLTITARTPAEKEIVRYELESPTSGGLASNLAATLLRARDRKTPAEEVVRAISECLQRSGPYRMKKVTAETNPWIRLSMERAVPDFEEFARNPLSIDMTFTLERTTKSSRIRAVATLLPERGYTVVQAFTYPKGESSLPPSRTFKVRCQQELIRTSLSQEQIIAALHGVTWDAMDAVLDKGATQAANLFRSPEIDARLERGEINPTNCHWYHVLPSGARIMIEEGDSVACIRIEGSNAQKSGAAFWRITSPLGLLLPDNPRLITADSAVGSLIEGDPRQKLDAIKTLDRMVNADTDKLSPEGRRIPPFTTAPIQTILGHDLTRTLSRLSRSAVRPLPPTTEYAILDLLDGFQSVYLTHRDTAHKRMYPQDPDYITFGFRNDGGLKITARNALRNHLDVVVPTSYFNKHEDRESCVERLARLFNSQTRESFMRLRAEMEELNRRAPNQVVASRELRSRHSRFPATSNTALNDALDTASEIALVYEADASASISDVEMYFRAHGVCEMALSNTNASPPSRMRLHIAKEGIVEIHLSPAGQSFGPPYEFHFLTPISLPEGREVLTQLFRLFQSCPQEASLSTRTRGPSLLSTPLFRYLRECEERFAVVP